MRLSPEGGVKAAVLEYLKLSGHRYLRLQAGRARVKGGFMHLNAEGTADLAVFLKDRPVAFIELKGEGQVTKKERAEKQAAFGADMVELGHRFAICKSVQDVTQFLGQVAREK